MVFVLIGCLIPFIFLGIDYFSGQMGPNPAQALEIRTGRIAISLLTATLAISPLARLFKQPAILQARRPLGLATIIYVLLHILVLVGFDYGFDLPILIVSFLDKPFIWFGVITVLILVGLAVTSFDWWKRKLGGGWKRLHNLIYLAAILDLAHYFLAVKGNLLTLSGNIGRPVFFGFVILFLLAVRLLKRIQSPTPRS